MLDMGAGISDISGAILIFISLISLMATLVALIILLINKAFGNKLSPKFRYYIWSVFIMRLLFPVLPESNISIYNIAVNIYQHITLPDQSTVHKDIPPNGAESEQNEKYTQTQFKANFSVDIVPDEKDIFGAGKNTAQNNIQADAAKNYIPTVPQILLLVYISVAVGSLSVCATGYFRYRRKIAKAFNSASKDDLNLLDDICGILNIRKKIKLYQSDESMLIGVFSPAMVLSSDCADSDKSIVMTHELLHYKNKDNIINILLIFIKCIYWFNPFIHYFAGKIKNDMEILCDINSIQTLNYRKDEYAMMLFKASTQNKNNKHTIPLAAMGMSASGKQLIYRLKFISSFKGANKFTSAFAFILAVVLGVTTLTNPVGAIAGENWAKPYAQLMTERCIYDYTDISLSSEITTSEYAGLIFNALKDMAIPYELKINVLSLKDGNRIIDMANTSLDETNKIPYDKAITREQAAYITDTVINYLGLYADNNNDTQQIVNKNALSFVPPIIPADIFEQEVIGQIPEDQKWVKLKLEAYFVKRDINDPELSERALEELLTSYQIYTNMFKQTPAYIVDPYSSPRELQELLSYFNNYTNLTDSDIIKLYMDYSIISTDFVTLRQVLEPLYVMTLPITIYANQSEEQRTEVKNIAELMLDIYIETTLADKSLTQEEYDYALDNYLQRYVANNYDYYKLKDDVTDAQKEEIVAILDKCKEYADKVTQYRSTQEEGYTGNMWNLKGNTSDVPEEYWDIYEKFDNQYDIPLVIETWRLQNAFNNIYKGIDETSEEEIQQNNDNYIKMFDYYEFVDYAPEHMDVVPNSVTIYKLRDDADEADIARVESYLQYDNNSYPARFAIFKINNSIEYKDADSISAWVGDSVNKIYEAGIMIGVPGGNFNPSGTVTWGQAARIINNILCSVCVY